MIILANRPLQAGGKLRPEFEDVFLKCLRINLQRFASAGRHREWNLRIQPSFEDGWLNRVRPRTGAILLGSACPFLPVPLSVPR